MSSCSRPLSREARELIKTRVLAAAAAAGVQIIEQCPLHPTHDEWLSRQERHKTYLAGQLWRCEFCSKTFKTERYLDDHLDRQHAPPLHNSSNVCVADFCDILGCAGWIAAEKKKAFNRPASCSPRTLDARRQMCQHMFHDCISQTTPAATSLFAHLDAQLCQPITCLLRQRMLQGTMPIVAPLPATGTTVGWTYCILASLLLVAVALVYAALCLAHRETKACNADLQRRRRVRLGDSITPYSTK